MANHTDVTTEEQKQLNKEANYFFGFAYLIWLTGLALAVLGDLFFRT